MEGNQNKQPDNLNDSLSGDEWDEYDYDDDYDESSNNNINKDDINNKKNDEIEIISPTYQKGYPKQYSNGYNKKYKNYHEYNNNKNFNHRSYKDSNNSYYENRNYRDNVNNSYYEKNFRDNNFNNNNNSYYEKNFKDKSSYYERNHYNRNKNYYNRENSNLVNKKTSYKKGNYNYKKEHRNHKEHFKIHIFENEKIGKPIFYNSKKQNNEEDNLIRNEKPKKNYLILENILQMDKINDEILAKKNEQIQLVKDKISKNLEKEYGALNINANVYVPKRKVMMMSQNKPNLNLMIPQSQI